VIRDASYGAGDGSYCAACERRNQADVNLPKDEKKEFAQRFRAIRKWSCDMRAALVAMEQAFGYCYQCGWSALMTPWVFCDENKVANLLSEG